MPHQTGDIATTRLGYLASQISRQRTRDLSTLSRYIRMQPHWAWQSCYPVLSTTCWESLLLVSHKDWLDCLTFQVLSHSGRLKVCLCCDTHSTPGSISDRGRPIQRTALIRPSQGGDPRYIQLRGATSWRSRLVTREDVAMQEDVATLWRRLSLRYAGGCRYAMQEDVAMVYLMAMPGWLWHYEDAVTF